MQHSLLEPPRVLVGRSPKVQAVLQQIEKISSSRWPVLILGETGTGKEVIAKNLHSRSMPGPFVIVDCSSLVGPLMESELFGHTKGAFTGAATQRSASSRWRTAAQHSLMKSESCRWTFRRSFCASCNRKSFVPSVPRNPEIGFPRDLGDEPRSRSRSGKGDLSPGPVFPFECDHASPASAA